MASAAYKQHWIYNESFYQRWRNVKTVHWFIPFENTLCLSIYSAYTIAFLSKAAHVVLFDIFLLSAGHKKNLVSSPFPFMTGLEKAFFLFFPLPQHDQASEQKHLQQWQICAVSWELISQLTSENAKRFCESDRKWPENKSLRMMEAEQF